MVLLSMEKQLTNEGQDRVGVGFPKTQKEFVGEIPVVLVDSPVLYSYLMAVHTKIKPHSGVEPHVKEIFKKFLVKGSLRSLISKIIYRCPKCRLREKKTELKLSNPPEQEPIIILP